MYLLDLGGHLIIISKGIIHLWLCTLVKLPCPVPFIVNIIWAMLTFSTPWSPLYSATHQIVKLVSIQLNQQNFTKNTGSFPHTGS